MLNSSSIQAVSHRTIDLAIGGGPSGQTPTYLEVTTYFLDLLLSETP